MTSAADRAARDALYARMDSEDANNIHRGLIFDDLRLLRRLLAEAEAERDETRRTFDLQWKADQRGIRAWQEAGSGRELTWPDRGNLVEWLLTERDALRARLDAAAKVIKAARHVVNPANWKRVPPMDSENWQYIGPVVEISVLLTDYDRATEAGDG